MAASATARAGLRGVRPPSTAPPHVSVKRHVEVGDVNDCGGTPFRPASHSASHSLVPWGSGAAGVPSAVLAAATPGSRHFVGGSEERNREQQRGRSRGRAQLCPRYWRTPAPRERAREAQRAQAHARLRCGCRDVRAGACWSQIHCAHVAHARARGRACARGRGGGARRYARPPPTRKIARSLPTPLCTPTRRRARPRGARWATLSADRSQPSGATPFFFSSPRFAVEESHAARPTFLPARR